ncbi:MAG: FAD-dependent oxidoreductase [bacterium]|nr:FAD-dependent oxidoreductase [bacterium]
MPSRAVVVGAGAIGAACAHFLARSGWGVTLVDRDEIGRGCSYANACLIVPSHSHPIPEPGAIRRAARWMLRPDSPFYVRPRLDPGLLDWLWRFRRACSPEAAERGFRSLLDLSRAGLALFEEMTREAGPAFFYKRQGLLHVYLTDAGFREAHHEHVALREAGFNARLLDRAEALEFEPALSPRIRGGLFIEGEAHGDCYAYTLGLAGRLEASGARLITGRGVSRITVAGGRARGVLLEPQGEEIPADLVVLAAGAWTPALAAPLGLRIPLQPAKGYSATIPGYPGAPRVPLLSMERRVVVTPLGDRLRFGGTLELAGLTPGINPVRYRAVVSAAHELLASPPPVDQAEAWYGFRPVTPDGLPVIGWAPGIEGLIVASGHAMLGFTQAPITGKLVAELADGRPPSVPLEPFRPDRF